jgi:protease-4
MSSTPLLIDEPDKTATVIMAQLVDDMMTQRKELMDDVLQERRKDRRHKNIRFALILTSLVITIIAYLYLLLALGGGAAGAVPSAPYAAVVQLKGPIADGEAANAISIGKALTQAFKDPRAKGVVLYINSPGGSPVQSAIIYDRIVALKAEHPNKPIIAVATDTVASGAYFVASAANKIYVNRSTITGSIGVISAGFGFADLLERFGVERRVFTAGANKAQLDAFTPLAEADVHKINGILSQVHAHFIDAVTTGRGDRLALTTEGLFEGNVWTGTKALEIGLVDGLGDLTTVLKSEFGVEHAKDYTVKPAFIDRIMQYVVTNTINEINARSQLSIR